MLFFFFFFFFNSVVPFVRQLLRRIIREIVVEITAIFHRYFRVAVMPTLLFVSERWRLKRVPMKRVFNVSPAARNDTLV